MKKGTNLFFKTVIISAFVLTFFLGIGYYYLSKNLTPAKTETPSIPYYSEAPQNAGILFDIMGDMTFIYLNFEQNKILVSLYPEQSGFNDDKIYGYELDYKINADIELIAELIDYLEGIELTYQNETFRYTGVQVADIILNDKDKEQKQQILKALVNKIAKNGMGKDMLLFIVENYETNLTVPDFYYWPEYIKNLCSNLQIIDS